MINHASFYIVTKPTGQSLLQDIMFESNVEHLYSQFKGGLILDQIVLVTTSQSEALFEAHKLLAMQKDGVLSYGKELLIKAAATARIEKRVQAVRNMAEQEIEDIRNGKGEF